MAPIIKTCFQSSANPLLRQMFPYQKPSRSHYSRSLRSFRQYSSSNASAKPRPYNNPTKPKPKPKPLVGLRTHPPPPDDMPSIPRNSFNPKSFPKPKPARKGVYAPYWRLSLGVVLCGALVYSMVPLLPPSSIPKLTYMHASSPPPYSSRRLQSQTETPSPSENPV